MSAWISANWLAVLFFGGFGVLLVCWAIIGWLTVPSRDDDAPHDQDTGTVA